MRDIGLHVLYTAYSRLSSLGAKHAIGLDVLYMHAAFYIAVTQNINKFTRVVAHTFPTAIFPNSNKMNLPNSWAVTEAWGMM